MAFRWLPREWAPERHQLLVESGAAPLPAGGTRTLAELFAARAARMPWQTAVISGGMPLTWAELDERSGRLAGYLRRLGIGPEVRVALAADRSLEMVVGLLGILRAGGACVPLDPAAPAERLALMLRDSRAALLLTVERWRAALAGAAAKGARLVCLDRDWAAIMAASDAGYRAAASAGIVPESLAYVLYAAGANGGPPSGAMVSHRAAVERLLRRQSAEVPALLLTFLLTGTRLVVPGPEAQGVPDAASGERLPAGGELYVLDRRRQLVPAGSAGELWTGGAGLARGYLGRPALTAERFVPDPWSAEPGARLHRIGDRARRRPDGTIEILGGAAEAAGSAVTNTCAAVTE